MIIKSDIPDNVQLELLGEKLIAKFSLEVSPGMNIFKDVFKEGEKYFLIHSVELSDFREIYRVWKSKLDSLTIRKNAMMIELLKMENEKLFFPEHNSNHIGLEHRNQEESGCCGGCKCPDEKIDETRPSFVTTTTETLGLREYIQDKY